MSDGQRCIAVDASANVDNPSKARLRIIASGLSRAAINCEVSRRACRSTSCRRSARSRKSPGADGTSSGIADARNPEPPHPANSAIRSGQRKRETVRPTPVYFKDMRSTGWGTVIRLARRACKTYLSAGDARAKGGTRTPTGVTPPDPKSGASTNSATLAVRRG